MFLTIPAEVFAPQSAVLHQALQILSEVSARSREVCEARAEWGTVCFHGMHERSQVCESPAQLCFIIWWQWGSSVGPVCAEQALGQWLCLLGWFLGILAVRDPDIPATACHLGALGCHVPLLSSPPAPFCRARHYIHIPVHFRPTATGSFHALLVIQTDEGRSTAVRLSGEALERN